MYTIKIITQSRKEVVPEPVKSFQWNPADLSLTTTNSDGEGDKFTIQSGEKIYVMNSFGNTIAVYPK